MTGVINLIRLPLLIFFLLACNPTGGKDQANQPATIRSEDEVFYLIFPRSFSDSNGDEIGDLNGVTEKLDYLQQLGVTSIIMTPLYPSIYYHNYFTDNFAGIDEEFGSMDDYLHMVREIHRRGMKFYMDTEVQYATKEHPWFKESFQNPSSQYDDYVFYNDSLNQDPSTIVFGVKGLTSYDGSYLDITTVNLYNPAVRKYMVDLYAYWVDPNGDGTFDDGVDGFRLDHTMDDLDGKGLLKNMLTDFWKPLIDQVKAQNPAVKFIAEQSEWDKPFWEDPGYGFFSKAGVDIVYSFGHWYGMSDRGQFAKAIEVENEGTPAGKHFFLFLDMHDTDRFGSTPGWSVARNKQKAAMVYLSKGIPLIYYGQELGMKGTRLPDSVDTGVPQPHDGSDVPRREAFEWSRDINSDGMATWYKDAQPYWDHRLNHSNDGISVEEEDTDIHSLLNYYRSLFRFRAANKAFYSGEIQVIPTQSDSVLAYCRWYEESKFLLVFNFRPENADAEILSSSLPFEVGVGKWAKVLGDDQSTFKVQEGIVRVSLVNNGFLVLQVR